MVVVIITRDFKLSKEYQLSELPPNFTESLTDP